MRIESFQFCKTVTMEFELHNAGRDLFKVDITQIELQDTYSYLALLNFNVPADQPDIDTCLLNIVGFLERHFPVPLPKFSYQVTASYFLQKPDTGEERVWTGSFLAGNDQNCSLSGPLFLLYERNSLCKLCDRAFSRTTWWTVFCGEILRQSGSFPEFRATSFPFKFDSILLTPFSRGLESCPLPEDNGSGNITLLWTLTSLLHSIAHFRGRNKNGLLHS